MSQLVEGFLLVIMLLLSTHYVRRRMKSLPPGPLGIPILGNMLQMPTKDEAQTFVKWGKQFG